MKNRLLILILLLLPLVAMSQVDTGARRKAMEEYKQQYQKQFEEYKDSINGQFIQYLKQRWDEMQLFKGEQQPVRPEPVLQPESDTLPDTLHSEQLPIGDMVTLQVEQFQPTTTDKVSTYVAEVFTIAFYGKQLTFKVPVNVSKIKLSGTREQQISNYWQLLNHEKMNQVTLQLAGQKQELRLNGWGLFDLTRQLTARIYPNNADQQVALSVYLLNAMHYDVRMGRVGGNLVILMASVSKIYDTPFTMVSNVRYYAFRPFGAKEELKGRLYTYSQQLHGANHGIDLLVNETPQLGGRLCSNPYKNSFGGRDISIYVNQGLMDFYAHYPQMELHMYANAAIDEVFYLALERNIKPLIEGKSTYRAVSTLLQYVQEGFAYQVDNLQFGREKNYFCEENFYYPANDCEDRALLFSYLVRMFVGVDVVLLEYADHVAAAVCFPKEAKVKGDYYLYNNNRYVVCDPTCKGAKVGQISNRYKKQSPKIIQTA